MKHTPVKVNRDSRTGQFISDRTASQKNPSKWERETVYRPSPKRG
jgi:hypothetical protein